MATKKARTRNPKKAEGDALVRFDQMSESIIAGFHKRYRLEQEHAKAYEKGLFGNRSCSDIDGEINGVNNGLKTDIGGDMKDVDFWYRIFARLKDAEQMEEEDRERINDTHRILFRSLHKGEMINFVDVLEGKIPALVTQQKADEDDGAAEEQKELEAAND